MQEVSNPCASGRCSSARAEAHAYLDERMFQTPAPRGGVPLPNRKPFTRCDGGSFKPLRLGAVFLCHPTRFGPNPYPVRFKPLRLGAVFLWVYREAWKAADSKFQTPAPRGGVPL